MNIVHNKKLICVHHFGENGNFLLYFFAIKNGSMSIHSIESYECSGKSNAYKKHELYHCEYKKPFDIENGVFVPPVIPDNVIELAEMLKLGFIIKNLK